MKLEQKRNFEALLGDTFGFVRETGAHFFPTLLRVNCIYFLAMAVFIYFAFSTLGADGADFMPRPGRLNWNGWGAFSRELVWGFGLSWWKIAAMGVSVLFLAVGALVFLAYTPAYMILYRREGHAPDFHTIVRFIRSRFGRLIVYFLGTILMSIPIAAVCIPLFALLILSVVGIALIPVLLFVAMLLFSLLLYAYLDDERPGFFDAISIAWERLKIAFWPNVFSNGIVYLASGVFSLLPAIVNSIFHAIEAPQLVFLGIMCALISLVLHLVISSLYSINVGMIYFSSRAAVRENSLRF